MPDNLPPQLSAVFWAPIQADMARFLAGIDLECSACHDPRKAFHYTERAELLMLNVSGRDGKPNDPNVIRPLVTATCKNCGHTHFFATGVVNEWLGRNP